MIRLSVLCANQPIQSLRGGGTPKRPLMALLLAAATSTLAMMPTPSFAASTDSAAQASKQAPAKQQATQAKRFASPQEGMEAFAAAVKADDVKELRAILGTGADAILNSGDPVEDKETRKRFTAAYEEAHKLEQRAGNKAWILVGKDEWPVPVPLVQQSSRWYFDTNAGKEELLNRRIGRNELSAIQAIRAYVDAQQEYYARNPQNGKLLQYAQSFVSSPNKRDGLYFPTNDGEKPSPLGPLFDARRAEGYKAKAGGKPAPYHGYHYRILKAQGSKAPGGAHDYMVNGKMIGGFALVAYPAAYGSSGIMTFMVNYEGAVYEKDLGQDTAQIAQKMTRFDPDSTWKRSPSGGL